MKPIINPWLFYAVNFLLNLQDVCSIVLIVCGVVMAFLTLNGIVDEDEEKLKANKKTNKRLLVVSLSMLIVITFIPAKETCYQMMIASQVTDNNIQKAEDVIKDSVDYIFEKIDKK
jgi:NADH:ubiquinone oxidoreductase subunit 6 (subunit J)